MTVSLLDIFFIFSGISLLFFVSWMKKKGNFRAGYRFIFALAGWALIIFPLFPHLLDQLGDFFGLQRGADFLVYAAVIFLFYISLFLLKKCNDTRLNITKIIREFSLQDAKVSQNSQKLALIVAAYNEGRVLKKNIHYILQNLDADVVVVNDGSSDETLSILRELSAKNARLHVLSHSQNLGQGAALETGFEYIRRGFLLPEFVVTFDADWQHRIDDVKKMQDFLQKHPEYEILLGSRFLGKSAENMPIMRKIILQWGIIFTGIVSGIWLSDAHNWLRMMRRDVLSKMLITLDGMGHASEMVDIIANKKMAYKEFPVTIEYSDYSLSKGQSSLNSLRIALRVLYKKFF